MGDAIYPVDVISMCSANGDILPLRLRMEDEDHQLLRIDIEEVVSSKKIQYAKSIIYKTFLLPPLPYPTGLASAWKHTQRNTSVAAPIILTRTSLIGT